MNWVLTFIQDSWSIWNEEDVVFMKQNLKTSSQIVVIERCVLSVCVRERERERERGESEGCSDIYVTYNIGFIEYNFVVL